MDIAIPTSEIVFRLIPLLLLLGTAVMGAIVCLNNITAPGANLRFVRHIMAMDTTNMDRGTQWREVPLPSPAPDRVRSDPRVRSSGHGARPGRQLLPGRPASPPRATPGKPPSSSVT